jgi:signal transduction histidine kinase
LTELLIYLNLYEEVDTVLSLLKRIKNPEFVLKSVKDIYSVRKNSENIKLAVDKASTIVFALKKFAHKDQRGDKEKANLIDNIETVLVLLHNRLKQGIEISKDYDEIPMINCYPDELIQVWTNLITNSIQAMNNQGELSIAVRNLGEKVTISITDNGPGIPDDIKEKIFEPFFTTKKAGEGTGIGLDLVAKIIEKHEATLDLKSEIGVGTTFIITLPVN